MIRLGIFIVSLFFITKLSAQEIEISSENGDCNNAIDISGKTEITANAPISFGKINEIASPKGDIYYFNKEHNTVWYKFVPEYDALLSFTIIPNIANDDYDFLLFECPENNCCDQIKNKKLKPLRTNISRTKPLANGITGLNNMASKSYVHEGKGDNFSKTVKVIQGKTYLLVVDNVHGGDGGHSIEFTYDRIEKKEIRKNSPMLNLNIVEKGSMELVNADITVIRFNEEYIADTSLQQTNSSLFLPLRVGDYYEIHIRKQDYLYRKIDFKVSANDTLMTRTIELSKATKGSSFDLENLYFKGGTAQFTGRYKTSLTNLHKVMKENPSLKINIRGHVNVAQGSYRQRTEEHYNELSLARAKAVYDYLVKRGISKDRMQYEGLGYSEMIFPKATLKSEMQKNRRVEIVVTDI